MPDVEKSKYLIVFNPLPNRQRKILLAQLLERCREQNVEFDLYPTDESFSINAHFFRAHLASYSDVIVIGGDGTFNLVVNLVVGSQVRVGLLPAGTGNDFARAWYTGKKTNSELIAIVLADRYEQISLGRCDFEHPSQSGCDATTRYFHNVLGIGFDAKLAKALRHNKGWFKSLSYLLSAIRHIPFYEEQIFQLDARLPGLPKGPYENLITVFANSPFFGNGLKIAPEAEPKSSSLKIVGATKLPFWTKMGLLLKLVQAKHLGFQGVFEEEAAQPIKILTQGNDIEADGEYLGQSPATISIKTNALKLKR